VRTHNEDAVLLNPPLYAVADGLGGHLAGEVASTLAIESLRDAAPLHADAKALGRAARSANKAVLHAAREGRGRAGMGTTLTAAIVEGTCIALAHVGDSRAYLLHGGTLEQLTEDHSMVADMIRQGTLTEEESRVHPNRSIITRALGSDPNMYADAFEVDADLDDRLLLCSDGLTSMLTDAQIRDILEGYRDPASTVRALVDAANAAGGHDNISVVVVDIVSDDPGNVVARRNRRLWLSVLVWLLAAAVLVFIAGWGTYRYARSRAYVVAEEGSVNLYRGLQGDFAGVSLSWVEEETTITVRALDPVTAARLAQGIPVEDVDAGRDLLAEYRSMAASRTAPVETEQPPDTTTP
jgi:protein phosphatase